MMVRSFLTVLALVTVFASATTPDVENPGNGVAVEAKPDPRQAQALGRWPNAADLARLRSVEGKPKAVVLRVLGHPSRVERRPDGKEVWDYPWCAACRVWIRKGVCIDTFYTAGY
jgi:hypothetical protein